MQKLDQIEQVVFDTRNALKPVDKSVRDRSTRVNILESQTKSAKNCYSAQKSLVSLCVAIVSQNIQNWATFLSLAISMQEPVLFKIIFKTIACLPKSTIIFQRLCVIFPILNLDQDDDGQENK